MTRTALLLVVALAIGGCYREPFDYDLYEDQLIVRVRVSLHANSEHDLESKLRRFADENGYNLRVARVHPTDPQFSVMMWRGDSMIWAANPFGPYEFSIFPSKKDAIAQDSAALLGAVLGKLEDA